MLTCLFVSRIGSRQHTLSSLLSADATQTTYSPSEAIVPLPGNQTSDPVGRQILLKGLDHTTSEPCTTCGESPQDILCMACPSSTIPHVRHGLPGICETCEGKSLATTEPADWSVESRLKAESEIKNRMVYDCACDGYLRTDGAYAEGEEWGDFLGPGLQTTPSTALGSIGSNEDETFHVGETESAWEHDRILAKKIQAEWSESVDSKWCESDGLDQYSRVDHRAVDNDGSP